MGAEFRPSGVAANASVTTSAAVLALTGRGAFVRVANLSTVTSITVDTNPVVCILFGTSASAMDFSTGTPVTLSTGNGIGICTWGVSIFERPSGATHIWYIGTAAGLIGTSTGDMG